MYAELMAVGHLLRSSPHWFRNACCISFLPSAVSTGLDVYPYATFTESPTGSDTPPPTKRLFTVTSNM